MYDHTNTWRGIITSRMEENGDSWDDIVSITLTDDELDTKFDTWFGPKYGKPFTAWTDNYVYFPTTYDGAEDCGSVPRHPNGVATEHQGGP